MATALDFPSAPQVGDKYPVPAVVGQPQYTWDGYKWVTAGPQVASALPASATPLMDATPARVGISDKYAREDHVHPTDTSQIALNQAVRYDIAQTATVAQRSQARANVDVTKKNYVINGAMMISQENGAAAGNLNPSYFYPADMFMGSWYVSTGVISAQQVASPTPGGSPNRIRFTVTVADPVVAGSDAFWLQHTIEGCRFSDLAFGTAQAKAFTLQFGVKAPAGTYNIQFTNAAGNRVCPAEYVISAGEANISVVKSVTIPGDTTGTWRTDNAVGVTITWWLMATPGSGTPGVWGTSTAITANQFNFAGTLNNVFELFDVSLTEGTVAPPFVVPDYASELLACQRYFQRYDGVLVSGYNGAGLPIYNTFTLRTGMRATPTVVFGATTYSNAAGVVVNLVYPTIIRLAATIAVTSYGYADVSFMMANARLS